MRTLLFLFVLLAAIESYADEASFRKHYVDGEYGQVHVLSSRPTATSQTAMVCLAPNPMAGRYYRIFMQDLGRDRIMHAPDYPGLGQSDPPPGPLEMADYADLTAEVLVALGYGSDGAGAVDICGYHSGAMVAIELAVRRPDLVRRLVLAGIPYYQGAERQAMYEDNVVAKPLGEDFNSLRGTWDFAVSNRQDGVTLERGYDNFVDILLQRQRSHFLYHAVFSYAAERQAARVTQPVLILNTHGSLEEETRALAPSFPHATLVEIPELEHGVFDVGASLLSEHIRENFD